MWDKSSFAFQNELEGGEHIIWSGCPKQGIIFRSYDKFVGILILLGLGVSIALIYGVSNSDAPQFMLIFVALGIVQLLFAGIGPFFRDFQIRKNISYALTNKRVVVLSNSPHRQIRSLKVQAITDMSLIQNSDGTGTILLGPAPSNTPWIVHTSLHTINQNMPHNFDIIEDVSMVYELIRKAQQAPVSP